MITIRNKNLDNFEDKYIGSTGWFNLYHEWFKKCFLHLNRISIKKIEKDIEGQYTEQYYTFVVPFDNTKLNLAIHNESVTPN